MTDSIMGSQSSGTGGGNSYQTPVSMTPAPYAALQSPVASSLYNYMTMGGPTYSGLNSAGAPLTTNPTSTSTSTYSAPITANESSLLGSLMSATGSGGSAQVPLTSSSNYLQSVLSPNYLTSALQNPALTQSISQATAPLVSAYQNVTLPQLRGSFAANGQVLNGPAQTGAQGAAASGQGSSAFDKAAAQAQTGLEQSIGSTAGGITDQFLNNAMSQQTQAATQAQTLSSTEVNNLVSTLQAEALPRLIQQYGMDQGLQEFNDRVNTMLSSLGLATQTSQPDTATAGSSTESYNNQSGSGFMGSLNQMGSLLGIKG